jgi:hypothetical protein
MATKSITWKMSVYIDQPRETVWDYTQDYKNRSAWDRAVIHAEEVSSTPTRIVNI